MDPSVHDVLTFHRIDRATYERLVALGAGSPPARAAVALLMWLHRSGACANVDAVTRVPAVVRDPASAAQLVAECHAVLLDGAAAASTPLQLLSCLCGDDDARVRRLLLLLAPDAPRRGAAEVLRGVGALVFDDRLHALLRRHEEGAALPPELAVPYRRHRCGTAAAEEEEEEEEDERSLFITFSKGFPLTRQEIVDFFAGRWGADCVSRVMMEKTPPGEPPRYGRIVLRRAATAAAVLAGRPLVKLLVNGRHLWARKYVARLSVAP